MDVIIHIDLDCFFVQVERKRNPSLKGKPVAVRQHQDIICVSYEARRIGVKKHDYPEVAQQKYPELTLVHVFIEHGKVSLRIYREEIEKIVEAIQTYLPNCVIEQSSIDEVYIDVSEMVSKKLTGAESDSQIDATSSLRDASFVGSPSNSVFDSGLQMGSEIASRVRSLLFEKFGFTSSAGIADNKMLAKIASGLNKPNKQTVVLRNGVDGLLKQLPIGKLPKMGGKLGKNVGETTGAKMIADLQEIPLEALVTHFGEKTANLLYGMCRGNDNSKVETRGPSKSVVSGMSLNPIDTFEGVEKIFNYLSVDLVERLRIDFFKNDKRVPQSLVVGMRGAMGSQKNYTIGFPKWKYTETVNTSTIVEEDKKNVAVLVSLGMGVFRKELGSERGWACTRLSLIATNFRSSAEPLAKFFIPTTKHQLNNSQAHNLNNNNPNNNNTPINSNITTKKYQIKDDDEDDDNENFSPHSPILYDPDDTKFICDDCGESIEEADRTNHLDMHFALKLQQQEEQEANPKKKSTTTPTNTTSTTTSKHTTPPKKTTPTKKKQKTTPDNNNQKISNFFTPTKKM